MVPDLSGQLNTEMLQQKWGPIRVSVIRQDSKERVVHFLDSTNTIRGQAKTRYLYDKTALPPELMAVQKEIDGGASIGETFRKHGFRIEKQNLKEEKKDEVAKRSYRFVPVAKSGQRYEYADIEEWTPQ